MTALDFLFSPRLQRILTALFLHPDESYSVSDLIRIAGDGRGGTQRIVQDLLDAGFVKDTRRGNQRLFQVNRSHPLFNEFHSITVKTFGLANVIRSALAPFENNILVSFVFGSMARGDEKATSDIDLLVVGDVDFFELQNALSVAQNRLGREIHLNLWGSDEWDKVQGDAAVRSILSGPRIEVIGDAGRLVGPHRSTEEDREPEVRGP